MRLYPERKGYIAWLVGIVLLELIILVVPLCRFGEFWILSSISSGQFDRLFPTALGPLTTYQGTFSLSSYENTLSAYAQQSSSNDHTYLINPHTGSLLATINQQSVLNADRQFYITVEGTFNTFSITTTRLSDNHPVWQYHFNPTPVSFTTQIQNGVFYLASDSVAGTTGLSILYAFSESTGKLLWRYVVGNSSSCVFTVDNGFVYILGNQGVAALNAQNGNVRWFHATNTQGQYNLIVDPTTIYILGEKIQALHAVDGQQSWMLPQENVDYAPLYTPLGIQQGVLYVERNDRLFCALEASNGKILWTQTFYTPSTNTHFSLLDDSLYEFVGSNVYAFHTHDGSLAWHFLGQNAARSNQSSQLLGGLSGSIYLQLQGELVALQSATGQKIWEKSFAPSANIQAIMNEQTIYYGYALYTTNAPPPMHLTFSISQALYYCSGTVNLFAIKSQNDTLQWQKQYTTPCTS